MASEMDKGLNSQGELAARISAEMVSLEKLHGGKGPTKCKTYIEDNLILILLGGGFTAAEQTAFESGRFVDVRRMKLAYQDAMEIRFTETIEKLTGRAVKAFMSASHQDPDLVLQAFILEPLAEPAADETGRAA